MTEYRRRLEAGEFDPPGGHELRERAAASESQPQPATAATLDGLTKDELIERAQSLGVSPANASMSKSELVAAIEQSGGSQVAYATIEQLAAGLRMRVTPENSDLLQACLDAAAVEIDHDCDRRADDPIPADDPLANRVNVLRGVEWYKANDAAFGVIGFDQSGALSAPRDGFNRHAFTLTPLKQQWGLA